MQGAVCEQAVHGSQEGLQTSGEPEATEQVCHKEAIQDGECSHAQRPAQGRGLDDINRLQGCVPLSPDPRDTQRAPPFLGEGDTVRVPVPPIRAQQHPTHIHKALEASDGTAEKAGVIFVDDLLLMASSKSELTEVTLEVITMFLQLGFLINWEKLALTPCQRIRFLGFMIDSLTMTLTLPEEKLARIIQDCSRALNQLVLTVRFLARLIGRMSAATQAILPAPLFYRGLQNLKNAAFRRSQSYDSEVSLSQAAKQDLQWWIREVKKWNGRRILAETPDLVID